MNALKNHLQIDDRHAQIDKTNRITENHRRIISRKMSVQLRAESFAKQAG